MELVIGVVAVILLARWIVGSGRFTKTKKSEPVVPTCPELRWTGASYELVQVVHICPCGHEFPEDPNMGIKL